MIAKHCWEADHNFHWDQKKVNDRESRLIPRKIKETIHSLITLICPIILISHIAQLLLICKFYCLCKGPHIYFKYA